MTEVSFGTGNHAILSILKPNGTTLVSTTVGTNGGDLDTEPLPDTGTYTVVVDPEGSSFNPGATTASLALTLSEPMSGAITIGGPSVPIMLNRPGQNARLTFEGTAGQRVSLGIIDFSGERPLRPDGTVLASNRICTSVSDIDIEPLSDTGTYTVVVDPVELTVSLTLTLSEPVTGAIAINGQPCRSHSTGPVRMPDYLRRHAGQQLRLVVSEVTLDTIFGEVIVSLFSRKKRLWFRGPWTRAGAILIPIPYQTSASIRSWLTPRRRILPAYVDPSSGRLIRQKAEPLFSRRQQLAALPN